MPNFARILAIVPLILFCPGLKATLFASLISRPFDTARDDDLASDRIWLG